MRRNSSFKLSKSSKRLMAATSDKVKSNLIKNMMIEAELSAAVQIKTKGKKESSDN